MALREQWGRHTSKNWFGVDVVLLTGGRKPAKSTTDGPGRDECSVSSASVARTIGFSAVWEGMVGLV
jgi:hypothetical protein